MTSLRITAVLTLCGVLRRLETAPARDRRRFFAFTVGKGQSLVWSGLICSIGPLLRLGVDGFSTITCGGTTTLAGGLAGGLCLSALILASNISTGVCTGNCDCVCPVFTPTFRCFASLPFLFFSIIPEITDQTVLTMMIIVTIFVIRTAYQL